MKQVFKRLLRYTRPYLGYLAGALLCAVASVTLTLRSPILIGRGVDRILGPGAVDFEGLALILLWLALTVAGSAFFQWLMALCTNIAAHRTVLDLRLEAFEKLHRLPLKYIDGNPHGNIMSRIVGDIEQISTGLLQGFTQLFTGVITILGTLLFMLSLNLGITLVVVLLTPISLFVAAFITGRTHHMFRSQSAIQGELSGYVEEMLGGQKVVKAFGYEQRAQQGFEALNADLYQVGVKAQLYSSLSNPCTRFVNGLVYAGAGIVGAITAIGGGISVGQLSSFLAYANQYTKPFNEITGVVTELQTAIASARRVFELLDEAEEADDSGLAVLKQTEGSVQLEQVSFSYDPDKQLIEGLNLQVNPGQRIAIVGPTGCGKTTLINLLMRFYDVTGGAIRVDGADIRSVTRGSLRRSYGMVLQETWLFSGTVRQNIAYGMPDATEEQIIEAAKAAHAHGFIRRLPKGYDTVLGEDTSLSQGQRQLLCIARVMLSRPPMLILDEATSSIDTRTELRIQSAFALMMQGRTSFIVAHRLSTIREADMILVMKDGNIIEQGSHAQLLAQGGFYASLYNSQFAEA